jgi:hypothetical protein
MMWPAIHDETGIGMIEEEKQVVTKICAQCGIEFDCSSFRKNRRLCEECMTKYQSIKRFRRYYKDPQQMNKADYARIKADPKKYQEMLTRHHVRSKEITADPSDSVLRRKKLRDYYKRRMHDARKALFAVYEPVCACCGESNTAFLTLDHVNNDGKKDRLLGKRVWELYLQAAREKDQARFQVLCWNCNMGKAKNGGICPHKMKRAEQGES